VLKRILVVDDHDVVRQGVRLILRSHSEWEVVGEAEDGFKAVEKAKALDPDVIILDISMPGKDGFQVIADLTKLKIRSRILVLTMHDTKELVAAVRKSGAAGCVTKTHAARDLVQAVQHVFEGGDFFPEPSSPARPGEKPVKESELPGRKMSTLASPSTGPE
jgi:DNA-binding NarL/FixJ family response regulator